jgi:S1-C subfamily serine protease
MRSHPKVGIFIIMTMLMPPSANSLRADPPATQPTTQKARPLLGIFLQEANNDVTITKVGMGSRADHMGLRAGDIIKRVNGNEIKHPEDVRHEVDKRKLVEIEILRDGQTMKIKEHPAIT